MGNQREIRQTSPRSGLGALLCVRVGRGADVKRLIDDWNQAARFYTYFFPAGEPFEMLNMDFACSIRQDALDRDYLVVQSGGKMYCGYENFVTHIRMLAPMLEDAQFFVADEEDYIDEFLVVDGELRYERVHQGSSPYLEEYLSSRRIPGILSEDLAGYKWELNTVGQSGGAVYRLHGKQGVPDLFLKYGKGLLADDVTDEMVRLRWLGTHVPMPGIVHFVRTTNEAWLLMTAVPGNTAYQTMASSADLRIAVVDAIALFLRRIHAIPIGECPYSSNHEHRLLRARARIDADLVDEDDFDGDREGWTAEQVWDAMQGLLPLAADPVVTHGDYSLDNLLIHDGEVAGCIDAGRVGIADRYQDLAIAWNCLSEFGASLQERFLVKYGIHEPDRRKLQFYLMLDELF